MCLIVFIGCNTSPSTVSYTNIPVQLDQEMALDSTKALNAGTQSLNRYHSVMRDLDRLKINYHPSSGMLDFQLGNEEEAPALFIEQLSRQYLVPLLPYAHAREIDEFDKANLLLAEYARNGISMSYQESNEVLSHFRAREDFFNEESEFLFTSLGEVAPNTAVRPKRMSVVNNCLDPTLWEMNASDAVGEMYHAWFQLPSDLYFTMIKDQNGISNPAEELENFMRNPPGLDHIPLELDRLRKVKTVLGEDQPEIASSKKIGAYSTQDSRRKVQRGFYQLLRKGTPFQAESFGDLQTLDVFDMHSFKAPGIYDKHKRTQVNYQPDWDKVIFRKVEPQTSYGGEHDDFDDFGFLEIELVSSQYQQSMIVGNIPVQLLVMSEDYKIPAFGAGVLASSERVERRYLRLQSSSYPHYAYLAANRDGQQFMLNNHPIGYEQIYLRPFIENDQMFLRFTVVSYERIVDLLEFNIPLSSELSKQIRKASEMYQPPIYEVYTDTNIL